MDLDQLLFEVYRLESETKGRQASIELIKFVEHNFVINNLTIVNELLTKIELDKLSLYSIVGLLRCTCRAKKFLDHWTTLFYEGRQEIVRKGCDPDALLIGLKAT